MANLSNINNKFLVTTGGNVLINKTAASNATVGTQIMSTGDVNATVSGDTVARFNRLSSDGEIIRFQNDTATDGAINCLSGRIAIGSSNTGIFFDSIRQVITPWDITDNDNEFNNISFGRSIVRFKDIYLSGKVVAGTGSTDAATINAFSTTVSAGLHSALRIIENTGASSYWDIGATNGASTILNFYHNANTTPKITFTHLGGATFAGDVGIGTTSPSTLLQVSGQGNRAGGNIQMGLSSQGANKWSYLTGTHYNSTSEPEGFALIGGYSDIDENRVVIGGDIYETNPATSIHFWTHSSSTHAQGGTQRMVINSSGNVGIGTTSPTSPLMIAGSGADGTAMLRLEGTAGTQTFNWISSVVYPNMAADKTIIKLFGRGQATNNQAWIGFKYAGDGSTSNQLSLGFYANDFLFNIKATGNVGIGTESPQTYLQIGDYPSNNIDITTYPDVPSEHMIHLSAPETTNRYGAGISFGENSFTAANITVQDAGGNGSLHMLFGTRDTSGIVQERMRITSAGELQVTGNGVIRNEHSSGNFSYWQETSTDTRLYGQYSRSLLFGTNATERMRIDSSGNVGIGTTSPNSYSNQTVLTINGTTYGRLDLESGGTLRSSLFSQAANTTLAVSTGFFSIDVGSERLRIDTSGNVGIGTTTPYARLNSYGAIISQTADNDPEVTLTNTGGWGVQSGGTIRVMQGFSRSGVAGDAIVFTYAATSWKSWSLDYIFSSTQGISQGTVGGYWNNSGTDSNVENIDNLQVSVAVTHGGTGNQNNIITFTFNAPGTHINCSFVYTQSGGDGAPRGDRVTIETISNTP
tara:strand:+ start:761 stop:3190 length:2430 start_codon:yes stop_codon:yes gene_type:complete